MAKDRWVIGAHSCREALKINPAWVKEVSLLSGGSSDSHLQGVLSKIKAPIKNRKKSFFDELGSGHQGCAVLMNNRPQWNDKAMDDDRCLVAFLDGISDPHNLGAILRTAWLSNIKGLFIPKNRAVNLTPTVCKVASGGAEHVPLEAIHFQSQIQELKDKGFWIYGLGAGGSKTLPKAEFHSKTALVVGAEGSGLRTSTEKFCDEIVSIPQVDASASYNASVAFAMATYEYARMHFGN